MFCMSCGKELPDNAKFCRYCGVNRESGTNQLGRIDASLFEDSKKRIEEIIVRGIIYGLENEHSGFNVSDQSDAATYILEHTDQATTIAELVDVVRHLHSKWPAAFEIALSEANQVAKSITPSSSLSTTQPSAPPPPPQPKPEPVWETCDLGIEHSGYNLLLSPKFTITASTVGPYGRRTLYGGDPKMGNKGTNGQGPEFAISKNTDPNSDRVADHGSSARQGLDSLIKALTDDGWQPVGRGVYWHSYRFQRQYLAERENNTEAKDRITQAINLIVDLRESGIELKLNFSGELEGISGKVKSETRAEIARLKEELLYLLRPNNDLAAAMIILAWIRKGKMDLELTRSGDVRVVRGRLSRETQAEVNRLKSEIFNILGFEKSQK